MTIAELLADFPVVIEVPICWGDMDSFQHVNNTIYFKHFEHGRIAYFDRIDTHTVMKETGIGPILAETACRFRIPLTYPDTVSIGTRVSEVGADRFTMEYRVVSRQHQKTAVEGKGVIVAFDYRANKKAALPESLRAAIAALEATPG